MMSTGETVAAFANQAAIAIENAQLHDAVRRHAEELEGRVADRTLELERERKRTTAILDAAGEGIMFTNLKGSIEYLNAAMERLTGYSLDEVLGQNSRLWQSGTTPVSLYQKMWNTITRGGIWQGELVNRRKDGTLYDAALTIAPVFDLDGQISGYVGVQRDITQQKELDRLKDEFVSNVSHELRTPIANVKLYISLLTRGKPEKYEEYLQTLRREAARLEKLIEDLLDLSRLDLGRTPITLAPTDVNQLAAQLIADRTALAASRQLLIDYRTESPLAYGAGRSRDVGPSHLQPLDQRHQLHSGGRRDYRDHRHAPKRRRSDLDHDHRSRYRPRHLQGTICRTSSSGSIAAKPGANPARRAPAWGWPSRRKS